LEGGARISYIFTDVFAEALSGVGAFDGTTDEEVRMTIRNANGTRPALFVPEMAFDILVRRQIARLETPGVQCVDLVYEELQRIALQSQPTELTRYPTLRDRMSEVVSTLLRRCLSPTQMMISNLVKIELAYINVSHPDFVTSNRATEPRTWWRTVNARKKSRNLTSKNSTDRPLITSVRLRFHRRRSTLPMPAKTLNHPRPTPKSRMRPAS
jgi:hypothetical protein